MMYSSSGGAISRTTRDNDASVRDLRYHMLLKRESRVIRGWKLKSDLEFPPVCCCKSGDLGVVVSGKPRCEAGVGG